MLHDCVLITADEVHVWYADLDLPDALVEAYGRMLTPDEHLRAERFCSIRDTRRFIVGRGTLRALLSRYLDITPGAIQICYGPNGKPYLHSASNVEELYFNLSHAQSLALYAVARGREIGVDVESIQTLPDLEAIIEYSLSADDKLRLLALPPAVRLQEFYVCWTRKEALLKAYGVGFVGSDDLEYIQRSPITLNVPSGQSDGWTESSRWLIQMLEAPPGYVAALATEGSNWRVTSRRWTHDLATSSATL